MKKLGMIFCMMLASCFSNDDSYTYRVVSTLKPVTIQSTEPEGQIEPEPTTPGITPDPSTHVVTNLTLDPEVLKAVNNLKIWRSSWDVNADSVKVTFDDSDFVDARLWTTEDFKNATRGEVSSLIAVSTDVNSRSDHVFGEKLGVEVFGKSVGLEYSDFGHSILNAAIVSDFGNRDGIVADSQYFNAFSVGRDDKMVSVPDENMEFRGKIYFNLGSYVEMAGMYFDDAYGWIGDARLIVSPGAAKSEMLYASFPKWYDITFQPAGLDRYWIAGVSKRADFEGDDVLYDEAKGAYKFSLLSGGIKYYGDNGIASEAVGNFYSSDTSGGFLCHTSFGVKRVQ